MSWGTSTAPGVRRSWTPPWLAHAECPPRRSIRGTRRRSPRQLRSSGGQGSQSSTESRIGRSRPRIGRSRGRSRAPGRRSGRRWLRRPRGGRPRATLGGSPTPGAAAHCGSEATEAIVGGLRRAGTAVRPAVGCHRPATSRGATAGVRRTGAGRGAGGELAGTARRRGALRLGDGVHPGGGRRPGGGTARRGARPGAVAHRPDAAGCRLTLRPPRAGARHGGRHPGSGPQAAVGLPTIPRDGWCLTPVDISTGPRPLPPRRGVRCRPARRSSPGTGERRRMGLR